MKNEIILTQEQRIMILDIFSEFSNAEKDLLSICCILTENGVTRRDLYNVLRVLEYEPSDLDKMLNRLVDSGLLIDRGDQIICPVEVKRCILPTYAVPTNMLVKIINKLETESFPSLYLDALEYKPLFDLVVAVIDYVVEMHPDNIEQSFASLVYNYAMGWFVSGRYEIGVHGRDETLVVRALRLAKENVSKDSAIYCNLLALEAIQFIHAFMYDDAQIIIDEIESLGNPTTPMFMLAQGYFWETYGEYYRALYFYYKCYTECFVKDDDCNYIKPTVCMMISFLTSLLGDVTTSQYWSRLVHTSVLPTHHLSRFYYHLINALNTPDEYYAEESLNQANECICEVNMEAPILARWFYTNSHFYTLNEQPKLAAEYYKKYSHHVMRYGATTAAYYIYQAAEISRLVYEGNLLSCKRRLDRLDRVPLKSKEVALSLRIQTCRAYVDYFMAEDNALAKTYCEIALELLEEMKPDEEIVNTVVNDVFNGHLPSSLFEESLYFDLMLVKFAISEIKKQSQAGCLSRESNQYQKVWGSIRGLREAYPNHILEIDVVAASLVALKNYSRACKWWGKSIEKAIGKEKYKIGLMAASYCNEIGFIWEAKSLLQTVLDDSFFLNHGERSVLLTELATAMEQCGTRLDISKVWNQAISEAEGTELLSKVYYTQAICAYNRDEYANALSLIDKCLRVYISESSIHDETLASILTYRSVCLSQQHKWSEAIEAIRLAMENWPNLPEFNLYFNLAFYSLGAHEWSDAKQALEMIKAMDGLGDYQKQQIEDLYAILRMPLERRVTYMQTYYGDIFT